MGALETLAVEVVSKYTDTEESDLHVWYQATAGLPFHQQVRYEFDYLTESTMELLIAEFAERKVDVTLLCTIFPDVKPAIEALHDRFYLSVVSSTRGALIDDWLSRYDLGGLFVLGYQYGGKSEQLQICNADYLIGDTRNDLAYAHHAGVKFVGLQRDPNLIPTGVGSTLLEVIDAMGWSKAPRTTQIESS